MGGVWLKIPKILWGTTHIVNFFMGHHSYFQNIIPIYIFYGASLIFTKKTPYNFFYYMILFIFPDFPRFSFDFPDFTKKIPSFFDWMSAVKITSF